MKNTLILLALAITLFSSQSFAFGVRADIRFNGQTATAIVANQWNRPIVCSGQMNAMDAGGRWVSAWMNNAVIYPGNHFYMKAYVSGYGNYFRDARANVNCYWY